MLRKIILETVKNNNLLNIDYTKKNSLNNQKKKQLRKNKYQTYLCISVFYFQAWASFLSICKMIKQATLKQYHSRFLSAIQYSGEDFLVLQKLRKLTVRFPDWNICLFFFIKSKTMQNCFSNLSIVC